MTGFLDGLRVLDFSHMLAGPMAARRLADFGAHVVKVEPAACDPLRRWSATGATIPEGADAAL